MKLLLQAVGVVAEGTYTVLSRVVDPARLDEMVVLHWCHLYRRHGMEPPPFIGMDNPPNAPTTNAATNIQAYQFTANATHTGSNGVTNITERGFAYFAGTAGDPVIADGSVFETGSWDGVGTTTWALPVTGLNANTSYRVRAYAINSIGTTYASNTITVTTDVIPAVAPTLLTPADNTSASGEDFTWTFNTDSGDTQAAFAFRRIIGTEFTDVVAGTPTLSAAARGVAFSPDSSQLAFSFNSQPKLIISNTSDWSTVSGSPSSPGHSLTFNDHVKYSPDGLTFIFIDAYSPFIYLYNTSNWSLVTGTPVARGYPAFSPDSARMAMGTAVSPHLYVWNTSDWSLVSGTPTLAGDGQKSDFSPDGVYLAVPHRYSPFLRVLRTSDWTVVSGPSIATTEYGYVAVFSPDNKYLVVGYDATPFYTVFRTSDWSMVAALPSFAVAVTDARFSPDGVYLYLSGPKVFIDTTDWSVVSGTHIANGLVNNSDFSPDGLYHAAAHSISPFLTVIDAPINEWWNGTTWQNSEVYVPSTAQSLSLPGWEV